jgi:crotonobetainyl-CoA:carnitine CoA-transferase CaiB-like acyl-CoA transferase
MEQALKGIRIADLTIITAGACATQMLADLGAEVIKVESGTYPDPFRYWQQGPSETSDGPPDPWNRSPSFNMVNRNKRGICLDLKNPAGRETFLKLVAQADAVTENFRQGVMDRLGIGYETLREVNPAIVMLSLGSQGGGGPESHYGSYGSTLDALSGLMGVTGYEDSHPIWSSGEVNYPDQVASIFGAGILLAALRQRAKTGKGTHIDLSQRELITTMIGELVLEYTVDGRQPRQQGNSRPEYAPNDCYRCAGDDGWVAISVANNDEWRRFTAAIDRSELADDARFATHLSRREHASELRAIIEAWTSERDKQQAMEALQRAGIRAGAVRTGAELLGDPHLNDRGYFVPIENTRAGHQTLRLAPYHLSATPPRVDAPAPTLGQDTEDVLRDLLGLRDNEIEKLAQDGVISNSPKGRRVR